MTPTLMWARSLLTLLFQGICSTGGNAEVIIERAEGCRKRETSVPPLSCRLIDATLSCSKHRNEEGWKARKGLGQTRRQRVYLCLRGGWEIVHTKNEGNMGQRTPVGLARWLGFRARVSPSRRRSMTFSLFSSC